jgi:hypothetical protein
VRFHQLFCLFVEGLMLIKLEEMGKCGRKALFVPFQKKKKKKKSLQPFVFSKERNPNAFNKPVAGGIQRKCKCKRSQCLKKYCECFQAGLPCLPECVCVSCHNYEGSDMRARALAGEDIELKPARRENDEDDMEDDEERMEVRLRPRRGSRRRMTSDGEDEPRQASVDTAWIAPGIFFFFFFFFCFCCCFDLLFSQLLKFLPLLVLEQLCDCLRVRLAHFETNW